MITTPTQPLTPSERRIAQHVIKGLDVRGIAAATQLKPGTIHSALRTVRWKLACPERCPLSVVAHHILDSGQVSAPPPPRPVPDLEPEQISLIKATTAHTLPRDIALAAGLPPADLRAALDQLLADTGAQTVTELIVLAHSWQVLTAEKTGETGSGVSQ
ncbi:LuxR C-terminal-related transcriptional regulator [Streptomyces venezuelae]|uniref:DNA-binding protein n=1 Tax=Streptomyces venezuelae TaxID=54571 RepID=A0A5P2BD94_STRVZ|nr:LuxR C-terminal-related transcriptional regulator [Streptomyces venezuelae]QES27211.1 DNA-binding protein [Streptomyces venezuelae]